MKGHCWGGRGKGVCWTHVGDDSFHKHLNTGKSRESKGLPTDLGPTGRELPFRTRLANAMEGTELCLMPAEGTVAQSMASFSVILDSTAGADLASCLGLRKHLFFQEKLAGTGVWRGQQTQKLKTETPRCCPLSLSCLHDFNSRINHSCPQALMDTAASSVTVWHCLSFSEFKLNLL